MRVLDLWDAYKSTHKMGAGILRELSTYINVASKKNFSFLVAFQFAYKHLWIIQAAYAPFSIHRKKNAWNFQACKKFQG